MSQWVWSAQTGILLGILTFIIAFVPILAWQYRSLGRWSAPRMMGVAATAIYVAAVATYTWLPLPPRSQAWCAANGVDTYNLHPFAFLDDFREIFEQVGYRQGLRTAVVLQVVFNVVLFVPWGVIVRRFFQRSFLFTVVSGFAASVFIEITQATGLWGLYPCAYRIGDIDDVITNTAGAFIGAIIGPVLLFWMPRRDPMEATRYQPRAVTTWRRYSSMLVTAGSIFLIDFVGTTLVRVLFVVLDVPLTDGRVEFAEAMVAVLMVLSLIYLPAIQGEGNIGMHVTWIAPRWSDPRGKLYSGSLIRRILRASVIGVPLMLSDFLPVPMGTLILFATALLSVVWVPFSRNHRGFSCWLTNAEIVDTRVGSDDSK